MDAYEKQMIDFCLTCQRETCAGLLCREANQQEQNLKKLKRQDEHRARIRKAEASGRVKLYEVDGVKHSLEGWALEIGITPKRLKRRLEAMPMEDAVHYSGLRLYSAEDRLLANRAGEAHTLAEWAEISGLKRRTLETRLDGGMTLDEAISAPVRKRRETRGRKRETNE